MTTPPTRQDCAALDARDPLAALRGEFELPEGLVYLDGNSLGALPRSAAGRVQHTVTEEWGQGLIRSWNDAGWFDKPRTVGDRLARLVGAAPGEVVVCDSTSVNLFKLVVAALGMRPGRPAIVCDLDNFPTDLYMVQGAVELLGGHERRFVGADGPELSDVLDEQVAAVVLGQVDYRTGRMYDMASVTRQVHDAGALMVWDLAHSAGALPVELNACEVDFAVGCTYKYLNGGPGAPAYLFVAARHQSAARQPLAGWHGHAEPFAMRTDYVPADGISRFVVGTPPMLSYAALEASLDIWERVDLSQVRAKSLSLTGLFIDLVDQELGDRVEVVSPRAPGRRGSQVSIRHPHAYEVMQALIEAGVIGDFRTPDLMRFGFAPLYVGHVDVWDAVARLRQVLDDDRWRDKRFARRGTVT